MQLIEALIQIIQIDVHNPEEEPMCNIIRDANLCGSIQCSDCPFLGDDNRNAVVKALKDALPILELTGLIVPEE